MKSEWWLMVVWIWVTEKILRGLTQALYRRHNAKQG